MERFDKVLHQYAESYPDDYVIREAKKALHNVVSHVERDLTRMSNIGAEMTHLMDNAIYDGATYEDLKVATRRFWGDKRAESPTV